ncbi:uncharacterized protein LOC112341917 isoform X1 [Selaginella moellendorffii]|uniref:uncharacterized protein LOC112341917 isoform X1 n=1 Tax=Selaginella moellendorffii TaxID=88036 RepID=UPI000D1D1129|nr:uncharacterized protein LOC112341917 isoform X1 [Selaginella moellendorffii]XP_024518695.1 uncharacterized protein LOC112341917 isoform X1 [Selaginella moellendorffii]|eukprot:XP_024518694.1 uncharacterized protein LOC112341917 isoform X1 [Selaginella moellendorffii]
MAPRKKRRAMLSSVCATLLEVSVLGCEGLLKLSSNSAHCSTPSCFNGDFKQRPVLFMRRRRAPSLVATSLETGTGPDKEFLARWRTLRLLSLPSAVGIFPAMLVEERTRTWRLVMFPSDSGIVKLRLFSRRIKSWSVCSLPNDSGMPPTSRLRLRSMKSSDSNLPNSSVQNNGAGELVQRAGNETAQPVVAEIEPLERAQVSKRRWYRRAQVVTVKIQGVKLGEACKLRRNSTNVSVFSKHQRLEASSKPTDLRRNWPGIAAAAPVEEEAPEKD